MTRSPASVSLTTLGVGSGVGSGVGVGVGSGVGAASASPSGAGSVTSGAEPQAARLSSSAAHRQRVRTRFITFHPSAL